MIDAQSMLAFIIHFDQLSYFDFYCFPEGEWGYESLNVNCYLEYHFKIIQTWNGLNIMNSGCHLCRNSTYDILVKGLEIVVLIHICICTYTYTHMYMWNHTLLW